MKPLDDQSIDATQIEPRQAAASETPHLALEETPPNVTVIETAVESAGSATPLKTANKSTRAIGQSQTATGPTSSVNLAEIPQLLGDYVLEDELGRGGMGIVYRARQQSVNRLVALKVIRPDRLASMSKSTKQKVVERFRIEAEAAARINHDNLVTVYEVGCEAGCHYFSMRYVEGTSLSDVVRKNPADNRQAAAWLEPVCRAVEAVHRNQIIHRDLKPQNILLEAASGRTLLADFGLAKFADDEEGMTQTGDAVGTPAYMSPEQFTDASSVTTATDVYGLGATLYCLLSGKPPFQASSSALTMKQVLEADALPLRQVNPSVDQDLETICMKCLEKSPIRRYGSAAELADELKRYLEGRPILARPISVPERAARWCRRNPASASMIGLTLSAIVVAIVSLSVANVRTEAARKTSEESFQDAMSAVNDFFTRVSEERLLNEPGLQEVRRDLLERARDYYAKFVKRRGNDPSVRAELAAAHFRMGIIVEELDSPDAALDWFRKSRDLEKSLVATQPASTERARALSLAINAMGRASMKLGKLDEAEEHFREAEKLRESLIANTTNSDAKFELLRLHANSRMNLGLVERQRGNLDQTRKLYDEAQDQRRKTLPQKIKDRALRRDLAKGFFNLANLAIDRSDEQALRDNLAESIRLVEALLQEDPRDLDDQYFLSLLYRMRADLSAAVVNQDEKTIAAAEDDYSHAFRILQRLRDLNPSVQKFLRDLAGLATNLGQLSAQQVKNAEALAHFRKARELLQSLDKLTPNGLSARDSELRQTIEATIQALEKKP